ncbi:Carbamoyl-phosphate synthase L chain ATP-binding protein [Rhodomicrobium vannielii ATCC 17100]|uniref:Carbamoyl-phosphate synthase L chain ATP-binding protein n=1 Tax=Rhodomicrobium vannielii (strain ATCC 17100 / DSM 162 / LMG 4299 / NCIMB 10020 / ATH 3.1.1) TaxID=648757 RepID=E3I027_RHOVT|nr:biotin carboxylase N-terminal domain-containing protein [Rhodomicrobium vannielii]ADP69978.1 Carbamoyl-phosphate synthase L chain ATP-binding protein [Rhodomicrobium vannielii ATCC 17100]
MTLRPFASLLIANRGEIACRIVRTARRMGLRTIAVYSEADARARHMKAADDARLIGPAPARDSYLDIGRIIEAAKASGAEAVHPGYGFLSEKAAFGEACAEAGLIFVGPPASAIRSMGSKAAAKALMEAAGVPVVPGYGGAAQDAAAFAREAKRLGFPVLLKAVAGGGGKGMRIVRAADELEVALTAAKREAAAAFGDDTLMMERFVERPRHIEVQIFADSHGNVVSLFERECTLQRRHQKVVEEAPSPSLDDARREALCDAARKAAAAIGYVGAGTVEFVADETNAWFIEMNTRLQVEHAVTEAITGLDLVEWQLRVAMGETLPLRQEEIARAGHAIEARIYAEDADAGFLPSTGTITQWRAPQAGQGLRIDTGFGAGDEVTPHYDPMLAKLIAHAPTRAAALARLRGVLSGFEIAGVATNVAFLARLLGEGAVAANAIDTGYIEREHAGLDASHTPGAVHLAAAVAAILSREADETRRDPADPWSPWVAGAAWVADAACVAGAAWALFGSRGRVFEFRGKDGHAFTVRLEQSRNGMTLAVEGEAARFAFERERGDPHRFAVTLGGARRAIGAVYGDGAVTVFDGPQPIRLAPVDPFAAEATTHHHGTGTLAPMPGTVLTLLAEPGASLEAGAPILILEAMKMEHTVRAPSRGRVARYAVAIGDFVSEGAALMEFEAEEARDG